eukprot:CAMPEP_0178741938 /NCGR_PEP_ID=MMETSP0744-20121128/5412_1 /TAXON_ID=913974 /ORGANISM="Nitzschia punctata, Strain CCMP561" /LENGTH=540 /DNA_ID=CAMNT_0020394855 /DNA_START=37 /DNA_END=1655 /DNA_ORIENTATION=+
MMKWVTIFLLFVLGTGFVKAQDDDLIYHTVIIGAGAAGLSASFTLTHNGIPTEQIRILEASDILGGRVRKDTAFVPEFPLDLGASYVQYPRHIREIIGRDDVLDEPGSWLDLPTYSDYTWFDFFNDFIAPKDDSVIQYGCQVTMVDSLINDFSVRTTCGDGRTFQSQHVIVTVPLPVLKDLEIDFLPPLPLSMTVDHPGDMWPGIKVFLEFEDDFTDRGFCLDPLGSCWEQFEEEQLFWDLTSVNPPMANGNSIVAGYILGAGSEQFIDLPDEQILSILVDFLDDEFDGRARRSYVRGMVFNWNKQPFIRGTLSSCGYDCFGNPSGAQNVNNRLWVAGEAFPIDGNFGWVDAGAFSGDDAAKQILELDRGIQLSGLFWSRVRDVTPPPTNVPTQVPSTLSPTTGPTIFPTPLPTTPSPTTEPTTAPTKLPTPIPTTLSPTSPEPTATPTNSPIPALTTVQASSPTIQPSALTAPSLNGAGCLAHGEPCNEEGQSCCLTLWCHLGVCRIADDARDREDFQIGNSNGSSMGGGSASKTGLRG